MYSVQALPSHMLFPTAQVTLTSEAESERQHLFPFEVNFYPEGLRCDSSIKQIIPSVLYSCRAMNQLALAPQYGQVG